MKKPFPHTQCDCGTARGQGRLAHQLPDPAVPFFASLIPKSLRSPHRAVPSPALPHSPCQPHPAVPSFASLFPPRAVGSHPKTNEGAPSLWAAPANGPHPSPAGGGRGGGCCDGRRGTPRTRGERDQPPATPHVSS